MTGKIITLAFNDNDEETRQMVFIYRDTDEGLERRVIEFMKLCFKDSFEQWESDCTLSIKTEAIDIKDDSLTN